jgi:hypothetical protein
MTAEQRARFIYDRVPTDGLFGGGHNKVSWRVSPEAFPLSRESAAAFEALGPRLLAFYRAANLLYRQSWQGKAPAFVADYLDRGKPESLVQFARMNRFKQELPRVMRPDILLPDDGDKASFVITELDSVPGGIGLTGSLGELYAQLDNVGASLTRDDRESRLQIAPTIIGGADGMVKQFATMLRSLTDNPLPHVAIVVSEESAAYRPEMHWVGERLNEEGLSAVVFAPGDLRIADDGIFAPDSQRVDVVYRFFELFDLDNVARAADLMNAAKKGQVVVTPPFKPFLEEKLLFALLQHPALRHWWRHELGEESFAALDSVFPRSWVFDARPLPPHAVIPDLEIGGQPVTDWAQLKSATQRERELILKISGFHPHAWGARGVVLGRDLPAQDWSKAIDNALADFPTHPHVLQRFTKSRLVDTAWFDFEKSESRSIQGRVRLCPYYFVTRLPAESDPGEVRMGGVLATICPPDKKLLHGMSDAIMCPCKVV